MKRTTFTLLLVATGLLMAGTLTGCNTISAHDVRKDMTPALDNADATSQQSKNDVARVIDHNTRTAWDDFKRIMLLDEPSRLHPYPIP